MRERPSQSLNIIIVYSHIAIKSNSNVIPIEKLLFKTCGKWSIRIRFPHHNAISDETNDEHNYNQLIGLVFYDSNEISWFKVCSVADSATILVEEDDVYDDVCASEGKKHNVKLTNWLVNDEWIK